ncbi:BamA/TamA family outer membrane protein [Sphingobacterium sp. SGL-16]|uniref:BamA/TamA family outer membrane protein n=1 Tax=Sphingobacterium sp. SGL-16 TaxID=2710883 RepID=UPI0013EB89E9|nr:BamA/TamA family outer membrane protein [Sphingobacterium sp. SGL-16]NGM71899.1 BamA/TamA family outer membrane protein [Sphingobacterium sp. SGL-16]
MRNYIQKSLFLIFILAGWNSAFAQQSDSTTAIIASEYDNVGAFHRFWLGDSYRKLYNTPVKMRVVNLATEKGGLQVVKLGGGMQTQSLRLEDPSGRQWVLRSIQKFPERSLPQALRKTIAKDIVQDQISIAHPFGALTAPTFNKALEIPHAAPELVYVGDDPRLGEYREIFKNRAYIFESRTPDSDPKTDNTDKVIRKSLEDNDVQVDQKLTLRARLLDFVLGDWDRHEDNWRWSPFKEDGKTLYSPVPRDRDKVFYKTSGVFPTLLSYQWLKAHLQPFSPKIRNVAHWNYNERHFDRFFLNHLNHKDWEKEISSFQVIVTDSLIHQAMLAMPDTIAKLSAAEIEHNIHARTADLKNSGLTYYNSLSKVVDLPLSAKNEFIEITIDDNGSVEIDVHNKKKDGTQGRRLFKRQFSPHETKEIRIYGIAGNDEYKLKGQGKTAIKVRILGGKDYDIYSRSAAFLKNKNVILYDTKDTTTNKIDLDNKISYRLKNDTAVHAYDYYNFAYDRKGVILNLNYGVDRGLILGLGYLIENQGFRKSPFAERHQFSGSYLTGRRSFIFDYEGKYKDLIFGHDLALELSSLGPRNLSNFFGYGNNTQFEYRDIRGIKYYRNRYDLVNANIFLEKEIQKSFNVYYGSTSQFYHSSKANNGGHFFEYFDNNYPSEDIYGAKFFTGVAAGISYDTRDKKEFAKKGIHLNSKISWQSQISEANRQYTAFETSLSVYKSILDSTVTLANRTGAQAVWGNPYFFQHAKIGGENSLRGFNTNRFTGKTTAYNNLDARIKLFSINSYLLPATFGVLGFYDIGRVWHTNEQSSKWHMGYGGGIYFMPADLFIIQGAVGFSNEATLPYIRIGMSF